VCTSDAADLLELEQQILVDAERLLDALDRHQRRLHAQPQHTGQLSLLSPPGSKYALAYIYLRLEVEAFCG